MIVALIAAISISFANAGAAAASTATWQKSASIVPSGNADFSSSSFQQSLQNLAAQHANYVTLIVPFYQSNIFSTDIQAGWNTPTDASLGSAIDYAHSLGLKVTIKPHLETFSGDWRANINPSDRSGWFTAYGNMINHFGTIAQQHGAEDFVIGTELIDMSTYTQNTTNTQFWQTMIANLRTVFKGRVTYSANWGGGDWNNEKAHIGFWGSLDYVGISAYWPLSTASNDVNSLTQAWNSIRSSDIAPLEQQTGKTVTFTEVGYRSMANDRYTPFDWWSNNNVDLTEQANLYQVLMSYWNSDPSFGGVSMWGWSSNPGAGGSGDNQYTPQNKPAQTIMSNWFGSGGSGTTPPPSGTPNFSANAAVSPNPVQTNSATAVTGTITNSGQAVSGIIIDAEIYNSSNQQVFQKVFDNQSFAAGQSQTYSLNFTPSTAGNYSIKLGVFSSGWTSLYLWQNSAATISASTAPTPTPTPTPTPAPGGQINIWWPGSGVSVSGLQPFKAMLTGADVSTYNMYWQVDGGTLNLMQNNSTDYPHKESLIDLSPWTWSGNGQYTITFVAKNLSGNQIATATITITVTH